MKPENEGSLFKRTSIRYMIFVYFTVTALAASIFIGLSLYSRMSKQMSDTMQEENQILIDQLNRSVDVWLRGIMKLSDTTYYGIVKNVDLRNESVNKEMTLLYDNNKDNVENIALFSRDGELLEAVPATRLKTGADPAAEPWFEAALKKTENLHFSVPHVQRVFDAGENQYRWVISAARAVEITEGSSTEQGVLLIDIRYDSLEQLFDGITLGNGGYVYLLGADGELIYHPQSQLIYSGLEDENLEAAAEYRDGIHQEEYKGKGRAVTVKTVGYTGWKIVGAAALGGASLNALKTRILIVFIVAFVVFILAVINAYISTRITTPIEKLERSVNGIEAGNLETEVYVGGSYEIRHLGTSIRNMTTQIRHLMDDIVAEHESKRKNEFDVLQSQINPHFLYYEKYKVRRYGFHGTSHSFVSKRAAEVAGKPYEDLKIIVCHLGNGASLSAVKNGKSVDTSMGLTPLEGLIMGTRSGDMDPAIMEFIAKKENLDIAGVMNVLNKKSGVLGLSGVSSDFRDIEEAAEAGNDRAAKALAAYNYRVVKYIGAYTAAMDGVDVIAFTAGLGENGKSMRKAVCEHLSYLGIKIDDEANSVRGKDIVISTPDSKVKVMVIPTNDELSIARETLALVK